MVPQQEKLLKRWTVSLFNREDTYDGLETGAHNAASCGFLLKNCEDHGTRTADASCLNRSPRGKIQGETSGKRDILEDTSHGLLH